MSDLEDFSEGEGEGELDDDLDALLGGPVDDEDGDFDEPVEVVVEYSGGYTPGVWGPRSFPDAFESVQAVDSEKLIKETKKKIQIVADAIQVTLGVAAALLKACKWNKQSVLDEYFANKEDLCKRAQVQLSTTPFFTGATVEPALPSMTECPVCWEDVAAADMYALPCKHFLCRPCWVKYLSGKVRGGPGCVLTPCPHRAKGSSCRNVCTEELFREILKDNPLEENYSTFLLRSFVAENPKIKWCPAPDCGKAVYCPEDTVENVRCSCGELFCFKCQREAHEPCHCQEVVRWEIKESSSEETGNWLQVNTHPCPNPACKIVIAKDQGCNHMTCPHCKYEFCWICLGEWGPHGSSYYNCSRFDPSKKKAHDEAVSSAKAALEKYQHYFTRYAVHLNSQRFEKDLRTKMEEKKVAYMQFQKVILSQASYLDRGVDQLCECRRALKWTNVHAFYLDDGREKELFEFLQNDLEKETERLSGLIESKVEVLNKDDIEACTVSAGERLTKLLDGCRGGLVAPTPLPTKTPPAEDTFQSPD